MLACAEFRSFHSTFPDISTLLFICHRIMATNRALPISASKATELIRRWIEEEDASSSDSGSDMTAEADDHIVESNDLEDEVSADGEGNDVVENRSPQIVHNEQAAIQYIAKTSRVWSSRPPPWSRSGSENIVKTKPGPTACTNQATSISDTFRLFITPRMMADILKWSNIEGRRQLQLRNSGTDQWDDISMDELEAVLGLLILAGAFGASKESSKHMWQAGPCQRPIFRAVMARERFKCILRVMRFDDKDSRPNRLASDKFAHVRDFWDSFVSNCRHCYIPSSFLTIDEQLLGYRGRCGFRQYIPSKPDRYGIKLWLCTDSETFYTCNAAPYLGKQAGENRQQNVGTTVVTQLTEPYYHTGRNVTVDNFFNDVSLSEFLLQKGLTLVGTMRRNKRDIPPEFLPSRSRSEGSSIFGFNEKTTMVSYVPKRNKAVILTSSMHHEPSVDSVSGKPDIILFYNSTKSGVDTVDQLCHKYTVKRPTKRWPLCIFYGILDIAAINSMVIWLQKNPQWEQGKTHKRRLLLEELGLQLVHQRLKARAANPNGLHMDVVTAMSLCGVTCTSNKSRPLPSTPPPAKKKRCAVCPRNLDRKVATVCTGCNRHVCPKHSVFKDVVCKDCST